MEIFLLVLSFISISFAQQQFCKDHPFYNCAQRARYGQCNNIYQKQQMRKYCPRSCGFCGIPTQAPPSACMDKRRDCQTYRRMGYCRMSVQKQSMMYWCKKTCNYCGTVRPTTSKPIVTGGTPIRTNPPQPGTCGKPSFASSRVVAGTTARVGAWPWQALMKVGGRGGCGGALVSNLWIVTAAHCVHGKTQNPSRFSWVLGEHNTYRREGNEQEIRSSKIIPHSSFHPSTFHHDIAMVKLERPVKMNSHVSPVCLPKQGANPSVGTECYITGWGKTSARSSMSTVLQQAKLPIVDNSKCNSFNQRGSRGKAFKISRTMLCGGDSRSQKHGCQGDSGGPFVCQTGPSGAWELHGAVSWGSPTCTHRETYTMFARVAELRNWIDDIMRRY